MKDYGLEIVMTIGVLVAGFSVAKVPCYFGHSSADKSPGELKPSLCFVDVTLASARLTVCQVRLLDAHHLRHATPQGIEIPFPHPTHDKAAEEAQTQT